MRCPADTSPAALAAQLAAYRRLSPARRLELGLAMSDEVRQVTIAGIRSRHPSYSEEQALHATLRLTLGDTLYREAWPARPLLDP